MTNTRRASAAALAAFCLLACANGDKSKSDPSQAASVASGAASAVAPVAAPAAGDTEHVSVTGTVAETFDAASYTYVRLTTASGDKWAAVPQTKVAVGATVAIRNGMVMPKFTSPTLKRTFDEIIFGTLSMPGAAPPAAAPTGPLPGTPAAAANTPSAPAAPVAKATGTGAHTVAEVFGGKAALKDQTVLIHGRVTKANGGILGKNWLHIADGTGSKATGDDDLVVTTQGTAAVGDVVLVRGVVHLDKDFGAGYAYGVIVEDATLEK